MAKKSIIACAPIERVSTVFAMQNICTHAAIEAVVPLCAVQFVVARTTKKSIVACAPQQSIVTAAAAGNPQASIVRCAITAVEPP